MEKYLKVVGGPSAGQVIKIENNYPKAYLIDPKLNFPSEMINEAEVAPEVEKTLYRRMSLKSENFEIEVLIPDSWSDAMALIQLVRCYTPDK